MKSAIDKRKLLAISCSYWWYFSPLSHMWFLL